MNTGTIILIIGIAVLELIILFLIIKKINENSGEETINLIKGIDENIADTADEIKGINYQLDADRKSNAEYNSYLRDNVQNNFNNIIKENSEQTEKMLRTLSISFSELQASNEMKLNRIQEVVDNKLDKISGVVDEKLDKTLNERLDSNFKQVGEQLGNLYKSLGELRELSSGIQDLNKTLTNVKTRGTWGEVQLGKILEQTLTREQYEENIATKANSNDRVEYAIKVPSETGESVYLPIDAKFPSDLYNRIIDASNENDMKAMNEAVTNLKTRIKTEARTIRDKYIDPPHTTNYAIMFLPTEGLYSEVLRIEDLAEECQRLGVMIAGPTTITALLNSLQAGFRNVRLSKKSVEVMKLLEAIKTQFNHMDEYIEKTRKKIDEAAKATDKLQYRTEIIKKKMRNIGEIDERQSDEMLEIDENKMNNFT